MTGTTTTRRLVLQYEYNGKRLGDPDNWQWLDSPFKLRGSTPEEQLAAARDFVRGAGSDLENKFIRAYRVVERTTVTTDALFSELQDIKLDDA